jgi:DHA2 family multidrug resistance protein-like MFS transporter
MEAERVIEVVGALPGRTGSARERGPLREGTRRWLGLGLLALPCLLYSMDSTVLNLAVPALSAALKPTPAQLLWILDSYGFMVAGFLITMGSLGDRLGRRRLLLLGAGAFGLISVCAAFAPNPAILIASRCALGVAGATLAPATLSLIRHLFEDPRERRRALGIWVSSYAAGAAAGPLIGGILLQYFWWGSVFLIAVPVMLVLVLLGPVLLPEYKDPTARRVDTWSVVLSLAAVLTTVFGIKEIAERGVTLAPALCIAVGPALGALFLRRQGRVPFPMIDLKLLSPPSMSAALGLYALASFVCVGSFMLLTQYMQLILGLTPLQVGLWTLPIPLIFVVGSSLTAVLARRFGSSRVMALGLLLAAAGFLILTSVDVQGRWRLVVGFCTYAAGLAPVFPLAIHRTVSSAPSQEVGVVSAVSETAGELGMALGIALLGGISTAVFRFNMLSSLPAARAADVEVRTFADMVATAHQGGGAFARELLEAARAAFMSGFHAASVVSAIMLALAAIWAARCFSPREFLFRGARLAAH